MRKTERWEKIPPLLLTSIVPWTGMLTSAISTRFYIAVWMFSVGLKPTFKCTVTILLLMRTVPFKGSPGWQRPSHFSASKIPDAFFFPFPQVLLTPFNQHSWTGTQLILNGKKIPLSSRFGACLPSCLDFWALCAIMNTTFPGNPTLIPNVFMTEEGEI